MSGHSSNLVIVAVLMLLTVSTLFELTTCLANPTPDEIDEELLTDRDREKQISTPESIVVSEAEITTTPSELTSWFTLDVSAKKAITNSPKTTIPQESAESTHNTEYQRSTVGPPSTTTVVIQPTITAIPRRETAPTTPKPIVSTQAEIETTSSESSSWFTFNPRNNNPATDSPKTTIPQESAESTHNTEYQRSTVGLPSTTTVVIQPTITAIPRRETAPTTPKSFVSTQAGTETTSSELSGSFTFHPAGNKPATDSPHTTIPRESAESTRYTEYQRSSVTPPTSASPSKTTVEPQPEVESSTPESEITTRTIQSPEHSTALSESTKEYLKQLFQYQGKWGFEQIRKVYNTQQKQIIDSTNERDNKRYILMLISNLEAKISLTNYAIKSACVDALRQLLLIRYNGNKSSDLSSKLRDKIMDLFIGRAKLRAKLTMINATEIAWNQLYQKVHNFNKYWPEEIAELEKGLPREALALKDELSEQTEKYNAFYELVEGYSSYTVFSSFDKVLNEYLNYGDYNGLNVARWSDAAPICPPDAMDSLMRKYIDPNLLSKLEQSNKKIDSHFYINSSTQIAKVEIEKLEQYRKDTLVKLGIL